MQTSNNVMCNIGTINYYVKKCFHCDQHKNYIKQHTGLCYRCHTGNLNRDALMTPQCILLTYILQNKVINVINILQRSQSRYRIWATLGSDAALLAFFG